MEKGRGKMIQLTKDNISLLKEEFDKGNKYLLWKGKHTIDGKEGQDDWFMILTFVELGHIEGWVNNIFYKRIKSKDWATNICTNLEENTYDIFILTKKEFTPYNNMLIVNCLEDD